VLNQIPKIRSHAINHVTEKREERRERREKREERREKGLHEKTQNVGIEFGPLNPPPSSPTTTPPCLCKRN
jgi:hypothetical protein